MRAICKFSLSLSRVFPTSVCVCVSVCQVLTSCLSLSLSHTMAGVGREDFMKLMQHSEIPGPERYVVLLYTHHILNLTMSWSEKVL